MGESDVSHVNFLFLARRMHYTRKYQRVNRQKYKGGARVVARLADLGWGRRGSIGLLDFQWLKKKLNLKIMASTHVKFWSLDISIKDPDFSSFKIKK